MMKHIKAQSRGEMKIVVGIMCNFYSNIGIDTKIYERI